MEEDIFIAIHIRFILLVGLVSNVHKGKAKTYPFLCFKNCFEIFDFLGYIVPLISFHEQRKMFFWLLWEAFGRLTNTKLIFFLFG